MVAEGGAQVGAESLAEFSEAFPGALAGGIVAEADEGCVAGVIAVGNDVIEVGAAFEELVEEMAFEQRLAQPDVVAIETGKGATEGIVDFPQLVVVAAGLFGGAGVMDVAQDAERAGAHGGYVEARTLPASTGVVSQAERGRRIWKAVPLPGSLWTVMAP